MLKNFFQSRKASSVKKTTYARNNKSTPLTPTCPDGQNGNIEHINILRDALCANDLEIWNNWRKENKEIQPNLDGLKQPDTNLTKIDFTKTSLRYSDLSHCNLQQARLSGANFYKAQLEKTDFRLSSSTGAAKFDEANMEGAMFPDHFTSWIRWHGPYRTKKQWEQMSSEVENDPRFRLYAAFGRWRKWSISHSQPLYIGLNSLDSKHATIKDRLDKHRNGDKDQIISGWFNEYWLGEIITQWHVVDTKDLGLTRDTERALIFSLDPLLNKEDHITKPSYSYKIFNSIAKKSLLRKLIPSRLELNLPTYLEFDRDREVLTIGSLVVKSKRSTKYAKLTQTRKSDKKKDIFDKQWTQRFTSNTKLDLE